MSDAPERTLSERLFAVADTVDEGKRSRLRCDLDNIASDLAALERETAYRIAALEQERDALYQSQLDHENDCAGLPEDVSVAEYIECLRAARYELHEAGHWLVHLAHGCGKAGRIAEGEWKAAWKAMQDALRKGEPE